MQIECLKCGTINVATARFCKNCGCGITAPVSTSGKPAEQGHARSCASCGTVNAADDKVCLLCGSSIHSTQRVLQCQPQIISATSIKHTTPLPPVASVHPLNEGVQFKSIEANLQFARNQQLKIDEANRCLDDERRRSRALKANHTEILPGKAHLVQEVSYHLVQKSAKFVEGTSTKKRSPGFLTPRHIKDASVPGVSGFDVPKIMRAGQSYRAVYTLGIKDKVSAPDNESPVPMTPVMSARLEGAGFSIKNLSEQKKAVSLERENKWEWDVVPDSSGQHSLHLTVTGYIDFQNHETANEFVSDTRDITVKVSLPIFIKKHWPALLSAVTALVALPRVAEAVMKLFAR